MLAGKGRQRQGHHLAFLDLQQTGSARAHPDHAAFILGHTHDFNLHSRDDRQQPLPGTARGVKEDAAGGSTPKAAALIFEQREPLELLRVLRPRIGLQLGALLSFPEFIHAQVPAGDRVHGAGGYPQSAIAGLANGPYGLGLRSAPAWRSPTVAFKQGKLPARDRP